MKGRLPITSSGSAICVGAPMCSSTLSACCVAGAATVVWASDISGWDPKKEDGLLQKMFLLCATRHEAHLSSACEEFAGLLVLQQQG